MKKIFDQTKVEEVVLSNAIVHRRHLDRNRSREPSVTISNLDGNHTGTKNLGDVPTDVSVAQPMSAVPIPVGNSA